MLILGCAGYFAGLLQGYTVLRTWIKCRSLAVSPVSLGQKIEAPPQYVTSPAAGQPCIQEGILL